MPSRSSIIGYCWCAAALISPFAFVMGSTQGVQLPEVGAVAGAGEDLAERGGGGPPTLAGGFAICDFGKEGRRRLVTEGSGEDRNREIG